ncbi:MAG: thioredoxin family protein [Betaproteobacteria bacterium]|nr:thioredoxin family protein [Betaproteobacteria bacterium]
MTIKVEVFSSPGCTRCGQAKDMLRKVAEEIGGGRLTWREVSVVDELDYAVKLGVLSTPAIAVNGRLVFTALPSAKKLRQTLEVEIRKTFSIPSSQK